MLIMPKAKESAAAALAKLDVVKGRSLESLEKKSDQLRKLQNRAKKQAEASRHINIIEKDEREDAVVKIVDDKKGDEADSRKALPGD